MKADESGRKSYLIFVSHASYGVSVKISSEGNFFHIERKWETLCNLYSVLIHTQNVVLHTLHIVCNFNTQCVILRSM